MENTAFSFDTYVVINVCAAISFIDSESIAVKIGYKHGIGNNMCYYCAIKGLLMSSRSPWNWVMSTQFHQSADCYLLSFSL